VNDEEGDAQRVTQDAFIPSDAEVGFGDEPQEDGAVPGDAVPGDDTLDRLTAERDEYLDALQRLKAEFDNYRKRNERERQVVALAGVREVVRDLLPVVDNLERAVVALGDEGGQVVAGLEMVRGQLAGLLAGHGVEEIDAQGQPFDPTMHEAIAQVPSDHPGGTIVEVVEKGYRHVDQVLRPTRVVVAAERPATGAVEQG
jgi:molecular chaperone GrpE